MFLTSPVMDQNLISEYFLFCANLRVSIYVFMFNYMFDVILLMCVKM